MELLVFTAAFYPTEPHNRLESETGKLQTIAKHFKIPLNMYGVTETFSFFDSKIVKMGNYLAGLRKDYTHVLYTDASDSLFLTGLEEIKTRYEELGSPRLIVSGEKNPHPYPHLKEYFPPAPTPYRYMNPGNFIGEIDYVLEVLSRLQSYYHLKFVDDQAHWFLGYTQGKFAAQIDYYCNLFQTMSDCEFDQEFTYKGRRLYNKLTKTQPCIVHFNGPKGEGSYNYKLMSDCYRIIYETN